MKTKTVEEFRAEIPDNLKRLRHLKNRMLEFPDLRNATDAFYEKFKDVQDDDLGLFGVELHRFCISLELLIESHK